MNVPEIVRGEEFPVKVCNWCDRAFEKTDSVRKYDFCSVRCEAEAAEESGGYAFRVLGHFPRIASIEGEWFTFPENPARLIEHSLELPFDLLTFRQHPGAAPVPNQSFVESDSAAILSISTFDQWWTEREPKVRNKVRKAEKAGVTTAESPLTDELVESIHQIYNETPVRQGRRFRHYGKTSEETRLATDTFGNRSIYLAARNKGGKIIGAIKLSLDRDQTFAEIVHILAFLSERDSAPMNALLAHAVRLCAERGIQQLGYAQFHYRNKAADGILTFKVHNGFREVQIPRYFVPMNWRGHAAYKLGMHHSLRERIPASVGTFLREARTNWLQRHASPAK